MNRIEKLINVALSVADLSTFRREKLGAIILSKKDILSTGFNQSKTHPAQKHFNQFRDDIDSESACIHAEMAAIQKVKNKKLLVGATIIVARRTKNGRPGLAKPCAACSYAIRKYKIFRVIYTTNNGYNVIDNF